MRTATWFIGAVIAQGFASSCEAAAIAINALPQAQFIEEITRLPGAPSPGGLLYQAETVTYADAHSSATHSVSVEARAENLSSIAGVPLLRTSGLAFNSGASEPAFEAVGSLVEMNYYFEVHSPEASTAIPIVLPVNYDVALGWEAGGHAFLQWEASIKPQINRFRGSASDGRTYTANRTFGVTPVEDAGTVLLTLNAASSEFEYYEVHLKVSGSASRLAGAQGADRAFYSATLDPLPYVDPSYAGAADISFAFSANLFAAPVPLPASGFLLAPALSALLLQRRRRVSTRT